MSTPAPPDTGDTQQAEPVLVSAFKADAGSPHRGAELRDSIFISYAHEDQEWCDQFLNILTADQSVRVWTDKDIQEGDNWDDVIQAEILTTRIALFLISPAFVRSKYIATTELPQIIADERGKGLVVKWVLVEETPQSAIPHELRLIQGFKVWNEHRKDASLSAIKGTPLFAPTLNRIVEAILEERGRFAMVPRREFLVGVREAIRGRRYTLKEEITTGDNCVVYRATRPGGFVIVKALVQSPLQDWKGNFQEDLEKAKALKGDGFLRLKDWEIEKAPKLLVSEHKQVEPLFHVLKRFRARKALLIPIDRVRYVLQVLAETLAEYHEAGLVFGHITPSDVLMEQTKGFGPSPRISAYRFSQMVGAWERALREKRKTSFSCERMTYMAPEQFDKDVINHKTDQYGFGLLAIELLQNEPPVKVRQLKDLETKRRFFRDPLRFAGAWKRRSPALTRTIATMLSRDPAGRWPTMRDVADTLGSPLAIPEQNRRLAKESYGRIRGGGDGFYRRCYDNMFISKSSLKRFFEERDGSFDWEKQFRALDSAILRLLNFSIEEAKVEPTTLTDTAERHHARLQLTERDFDRFLRAVLKTLKQFDEGSEEMTQAWTSTLEPGIEYMKRHASRRARGAERPSKTS